MSGRGLNALYESLARYQWLRHRVRTDRGEESLAMHKRLAPAPATGASRTNGASHGDGPSHGPGAGAAALNGWLFARVQPPAGARVLDVGCGFGATLFDWAARGNVTGLGVTPSPFQVRKARGEAARRRLDDRVRFAVRSYDPPWSERFDTVVAIESLAHATDLGRTVQGLADALEPGGTLALVDDMAVDDLGDDPDARELTDRWAAPASLPTEAAFRRALAGAGLTPRVDIDLTGQVPARSETAVTASGRRLTRLRRLVLLPGPRRVLDAFLGGLALERLYARGRMRYRAVIATREEGSPTG